MKQEYFEKNNSKLWLNYQSITRKLLKKKSGQTLSNPAEFPALYRKICNHYAISLTRQYSPNLVSKMHDMVLSGHKIIYKSQSIRLSGIVTFFSVTFPVTLRAHFMYFIVALALFLVPAAGTGLATYFQQDFVYSIMDENQVSQFEYMYDPANRAYGRTEEQQGAKNIYMFGFYVKNNTSIGIRTFAGGILAGVGTFFFLISNGIFIGAAAGHVTRLGFTGTFWPFVCGHGAFELTAIVISGMAGLVLAKAVIAPGNLKRSDALKTSAVTALNLMLGAASMFVIAAFIEAFWSPSGLDAHIKYIGATVLWAIVVQYFVWAGRRKAGKRASVGPAGSQTS